MGSTVAALVLVFVLVTLIRWSKERKFKPSKHVCDYGPWYPPRNANITNKDGTISTQLVQVRVCSGCHAVDVRRLVAYR